MSGTIVNHRPAVVRARKIFETNKDEVVWLYLSGKTIRAVASHFGIGATFLDWKLSELGVKRSPKEAMKKRWEVMSSEQREAWSRKVSETSKRLGTRPPASNPSQEPQQRAIYEANKHEIYSAYVNDQLTMSQVAEEFGISRGYLAQFLGEDGIKRSRSAEAKIRYAKSHVPRISSYEQLFAKYLTDRHISFTVQYVLPGSTLIFDFYIPELHLLVEVDGEFWHSLDRHDKFDPHEIAHVSDLRKSLLAIEAGYRLVRITDKQIDYFGYHLLQEILDNTELYTFKTDTDIVKYRKSDKFDHLEEFNWDGVDLSTLPKLVRERRAHYKYRRDINIEEFKEFVLTSDQRYNLHDLCVKYNCGNTVIFRLFEEAFPEEAQKRSLNSLLNTLLRPPRRREGYSYQNW